MVPDSEIVESLIKRGLIRNEESAKFTALAGGVSSDIWRVETDERTFCVKRALAKLKVDADWFAPIERNRFEVAWYRVANNIVPGAAPEILAHDEKTMLCVMEYLDPDIYKLWKNELKDGRTNVAQSAQSGEILGRIHAGTAGSVEVGAHFPRADIFHAIRLEPYLEATAGAHPDLREQLYFLSERTGKISLTMVHGDVSPKNILMGPNGPVFLDAECACFGDPAFDLAFCLNHFLLKCLWNPSAREGYLSSFKAMAESYREQVNWEDAAGLEHRAATLLPGLFLARIDGKSPVEYVTDDHDKNKVRRCARSLLIDAPAQLVEIAHAWDEELSK
ncbi:MAG: phosphotransferase family protein [Hyphomicrobiales bacterium]